MYVCMYHSVASWVSVLVARGGEGVLVAKLDVERRKIASGLLMNVSKPYKLDYTEDEYIRTYIHATYINITIPWLKG